MADNNQIVYVEDEQAQQESMMNTGSDIGTIKEMSSVMEESTHEKSENEKGRK
jgi:hypothetical protein